MQSWEGKLSLADTARVCCVGLDCFYWSAGGNESAFLQWVRFRMVAVEDLSDGLESSMRGHGRGASGCPGLPAIVCGVLYICMSIRRVESIA